MRRLLSYFSFQGRTNRQRFWVTAMTIAGFYFLAAIICGAMLAIPVIGILAGLLLIGVVLATGLAMLANGARRLHDRGKSAWWLLLFQGVPMVLTLLGGLVSLGAGNAGALVAGALVAGALVLVSLPITIWAFVELGCLKGTSGPNRFGPDPLAQTLDEAAFA